MGVVIYPPTIDWEYMKQRPHHLMRQFAAHGFTVFYYNKYSRTGPVFYQVAPNLYVINHSTFFTNHIWPHLTERKPTLYWTSWSRKLPLAHHFTPDIVVYDCVDDFPEWEEEERKYAKLADIIICTADKLVDKMKRQLPSKPLYKIPNGCDWDFFASVATHQANPLPDKPLGQGKVIGYIGAWAPWVDEHLIRYTAQRLPHTQIWIIGPQLRPTITFDETNIFLLGHKEYEQLPDYLAHIDVCIIPFRLNRITRSTNPIKVYEYLATGKPVVATNLPELRPLTPLVRTASNQCQFVRYVREGLRDGDRLVHQRMDMARQHSWQHRLQHTLSALQENFPHFTPSSLSIPPELQNYTARSIPLRHCTVNSYYRNVNLNNDPIFIGQRNAYACLFEGLSYYPNATRLYLEFTFHFNFTSEHQIPLTLSTPTAAWSVDSVTYAGQPPLRQLDIIPLAMPISHTVSIDITPFREKLTPFGFHLTTDWGEVLRLENVRLTLIEKEEGQG